MDGKYLAEVKVDRPIVVSSLSRPTRFVVVDDYRGGVIQPAIRFAGDRIPNSEGEILPPVVVDCGWRCPGVVFDRCEHWSIDAVKVLRPLGFGIRLESIRESSVRSLQVSESLSDSDPAVEICSSSEFSGDATNGCDFGEIRISACQTTRYLVIRGGGKRNGLHWCRNNIFQKIWCHVMWDAQLDMLPETHRSQFSNDGNRTLLQLGLLDNCVMPMVILRNNPSVACETVKVIDELRRLEIRGRVRHAPASSLGSLSNSFFQDFDKG